MYICIKPFARRGIGGTFNIKTGELLEKEGEYLYYKGRPVCVARSYAAHEYFAENEDGKGAERYALSHAIIDALNKSEVPESTRKGGDDEPKADFSPEWAAVMEDKIAQQYKREDYGDTWLWGDKFYNAPIEVLEHIASLCGAKAAVK